MTKEETNYNKSALQKLTEKYLASSILSEEILCFLQQQKNIPPEQIAKLLADKSGKNQNSIYKNINELTNFSASSLLRYWSAMMDICKQFNVSSNEVPSLDSLVIKYKYLLDFINQISIEHKLESLVTIHAETAWEIYKFYSSKDKKISSNYQILLDQISNHPQIQDKLTQRKIAKIERMKEK